MAWASVCPKLSLRRSPVSCSSRSTISALTRTAAEIASVSRSVSARRAHVSRRGETRHVGHDAASDGEHERGAVRAQLDKTPVDGFHGLQGLYAFARTDEHRVVRRQQRMVKAVDRSVGNDDHAPLRQHPGEDVGRGTDVNLALFPNVEGGFHDL